MDDQNNEYYQQEMNRRNLMGEEEVKKSNPIKIVYGIIGFIAPIIGLILFIVFKNTNKEYSKASGTGALLGFFFGWVISLIFSLLFNAFVNTAELQTKCNDLGENYKLEKLDDGWGCRDALTNEIIRIKEN
jgi:hypothetical protein